MIGRIALATCFGVIAGASAMYFGREELLGILPSPKLSSHSAIAQLPPENTDRLDVDIAAIREKIIAANTEAQNFEGGLIKALILARIETMKVTEAMLEQRLQAARIGAKYIYTLESPKLDLERLERINRDIGVTQAKLADAEAQLPASGGLVGAIQAMTVATHKQSIAMLEQGAIAARYGLATIAVQSLLPEGGASALAGSPPKVSDRLPITPTVRDLKPRSPTIDCIEYQNQEWVVLDRNRIFHEVAWKVELRNKCDYAISVSVEFGFLDANDFEIDMARGSVSIGANSSSIARGKGLISPPEKAARVVKSEARWRPQ